MVLMILERVSPSLKGELSRWMIEPKSGVFIGNLSALVRDKLWDKVRYKSGECGACMLIWTTNNEQGFKIDAWGDTSRKVREFEGLQLVTKA
ncbi:MAG: type I-E CRISPR-associated endoribonuclease Cas2e [Candidatus Glassbacteria bacterium]